MFSKIGVLFALAAPLVSALTITTPSGWTSSDRVNITWTAVNGDPQEFSIFLINTAFHDSFAIANNVPTGAMEVDNLLLPVVPATDGYTLTFTDVGNNSDIFATSGSFSIGAATSTLSSTVSSTSSSSSGVPSTAPTVTPTLPLSSSGFGQTVSATSGVSTSSGSASGTGTGTGTSTSPIGSSSAFNNGAVALGVSHGNLASFALMAVGAIAGARFAGF